MFSKVLKPQSVSFLNFFGVYKQFSGHSKEFCCYLGIVFTLKRPIFLLGFPFKTWVDNKKIEMTRQITTRSVGYFEPF